MNLEYVVLLFEWVLPQRMRLHTQSSFFITVVWKRPQ